MWLVGITISYGFALRMLLTGFAKPIVRGVHVIFGSWTMIDLSDMGMDAENMI